MIDHISTGRSRLKSTAARVVEAHLGLKMDDQLEEDDTIGKLELNEANKKLVQTALDANNFVYREYVNRDVGRGSFEHVFVVQLTRLQDRGGVFRSPMIRRVLLALFDGENSEGALSWNLYANGIPVATLAFVCTAVSLYPRVPMAPCPV